MMKEIGPHVFPQPKQWAMPFVGDTLNDGFLSMQRTAAFVVRPRLFQFEPFVLKNP